MTGCEARIDRMSLLARRGVAPSGEQLAHLESCPDCHAQWAVLQAAAGLGGELTPMDAERLTRRVLDRIGRTGDGERRRPWLRAAPLAGVAAAVVLALLLHEPARPGLPARDAVEPAGPFPLAELDGADPEQLEQVLAEFEEPLAGYSTLGPGFEDLDQVQLDRALRAWEES